MLPRLSRRNRVLTTVLGMVGGVLAFAPSALADTVTVDSQHYDLGYIDGHHYANFARITSSDTHVRGTVDIHVSPGDAMPANDVAATIHVFRNGTECAETSAAPVDALFF